MEPGVFSPVASSYIAISGRRAKRGSLAGHCTMVQGRELFSAIWDPGHLFCALSSSFAVISRHIGDGGWGKEQSLDRYVKTPWEGIRDPLAGPSSEKSGILFALERGPYPLR